MELCALHIRTMTKWQGLHTGCVVSGLFYTHIPLTLLAGNASRDSPGLPSGSWAAFCTLTGRAQVHHREPGQMQHYDWSTSKHWFLPSSWLVVRQHHCQGLSVQCHKGIAILYQGPCRSTEWPHSDVSTGCLLIACALLPCFWPSF